MSSWVRISASVIAGMMSTHEDMLDQHVANHTWMFFPRGLSQFGDWPDLAASAAPKGLLVQYLLDDELFPSTGVTNADAIIKAYYRDAGCANRYVGQFFPGAHRFDLEMQGAAFDWLAAQLGGGSAPYRDQLNRANAPHLAYRWPVSRMDFRTFSIRCSCGHIGGRDGLLKRSSRRGMRIVRGRRPPA